MSSLECILAVKASAHPPAAWCTTRAKVGDRVTLSVGGNFVLHQTMRMRRHMQMDCGPGNQKQHSTTDCTMEAASKQWLCCWPEDIVSVQLTKHSCAFDHKHVHYAAHILPPSEVCAPEGQGWRRTKDLAADMKLAQQKLVNKCVDHICLLLLAMNTSP